MAATGPQAATGASVPLQWPLVDRHEQIELFTSTLADPRAHGFVIHGSAGLGKTRLADQCLATADGEGRNVARATATPGSQSVPLDALAHLLIAVGRCETALAQAVSEFAEHMEMPDQVAISGPGDPHHQPDLRTRRVRAVRGGWCAGGRRVRGHASTAPPDASMWSAQQQGRCALLSGRVDTVRRWLSEALVRCEANNIVGPRRLVLSALATAHGSLGDAAAARSAAAELDRLPPFPFTPAEQELGRAWALVSAGDLAGARRLLRAAAETARECGYHSSEAWLLHDIARLGDAAAGASEGARTPALVNRVIVVR